MTLYAVARVLGNGLPARTWTTTTGPYRLASYPYGSQAALIPPGATWGIVRCGPDFDTAAANADPLVIADAAWTGDHLLTSQERNRLNTALASLGATTRVVTGQSIQSAIQALCVELGDPTWQVPL